MIHATKGSLWRGKPRLQLQPADWPPEDQRCWEIATETGSILDPGGEASEWSTATRRTVTKAYGRWLTWLGSHDGLDPGMSILARVTAERVAAYTAELGRTTGSSTVWSYVHGLAMMLDVLIPERAPAWLWQAVLVFKRSAAPSGRKRGRVVASSVLLAYGIALMDGVGPAAASNLALAAQFRDGLMIVLLAARPVRMRNFVSIEIGRHLVQRTSGYDLQFEATETKTHREIDVSVPTCLIDYLDRYLTTIRPTLLAQHGSNKSSRTMDTAGAALWVTNWGTRMSEPTLHARIVALTRSRFGQSINPHLFRDCAATSIAMADPNNMAITLHVLGHTTLATSERFYNHAMALKAADIHQAEIAAIRREAAQKAPKPGAGRSRSGAGTRVLSGDQCEST